MEFSLWITEIFHRRKRWILTAFILFVVEFVCLIWPVHWLGEEKVNFLAGEGSWTLESQGEVIGYCQEFQPEYPSIKSIGIVATTGEKPLGSGEMLVVVTDGNAQVLFRITIPYE